MLPSSLLRKTVAAYVSLAALGISQTTLAGSEPGAGEQDAIQGIRHEYEGVYQAAFIQTVFAGKKEFCFARVIDARRGQLPVNSLICTVFPDPRHRSGEEDECACLALICLKDDIAFELKSKSPRDELQLTEALSHRLTDAECELVRENLEKIRNGTTSKTFFLPGPVVIYSSKQRNRYLDDEFPLARMPINTRSLYSEFFYDAEAREF